MENKAENIEDQIAFSGPLTVREIRKALSIKTPLALIGRRATISDSQPSRKVYPHTPTMDSMVRERYYGCDDDETFVSFISEYATGNDTSLVDKSSLLSNNRNCACSTPKSSAQPSSPNADFINQVSKALDFVPGVCNYKMEKSLSMSELRLNSPESEFVDPTVVVLSDEEDYNISEESVLQPKLETSSVIYITSDSDASAQEEHLIKNEAASVTTEILPVEKKSDFEENLLVKAEVEAPLKAADESQDENKSNILKGVDEIYISSDEASDSFDCEFNDTLAEIELALQKGLNYTMPQELTNDSDLKTTALDNPKVSPNPANNCRTSPALSVDSSKISNIKIKKEKPKKTLIPISTGSSTTTLPIIRGSPAKIGQKQDFGFKIPLKPPSHRQTPGFPNVVSPVALYIKNSSQVPQVQHVIPKPLAAGCLFPKTTSSPVINREDGELPTRIYKPAQQTLTAKTEEVKLPGSIQKHIRHTPDIIKHQGRIGGKESEPDCVEAQLLKEDITVSLDDTIDLNSSSLPVHNISMLTSKKAYIL